MFTYSVVVGLGDTDAMGVLFFPVQFQWAMRAFEAYLYSINMPLSRLFQTKYRFPVVHAEADYLKPLAIGDFIDITITGIQKGTHSLSFSYLLTRNKEQVGFVKTVHVLIDEKTKAKTEWPEELQRLFAVYF